MQTPEYAIGEVEVEGVPCTQVCVWLPGVKSVGEVDLEVSADELCVSVEELYELTLELPHSIDEDNPSARYDKAMQKLTMTLPHL